MGKENNLTDFLTDIADGIREKRGTTAKINPQNFRSEIEQIETKSPEWDGGYETSPDTEIVGGGGECPAPNLITKTVTENNKTYKASEDGADGYSEVNVEVPMPVIIDASDVPITENGTYEAADYGIDGISKIVVAVPETIPDGYIQPSGNKHITENGENIPVAEFATVSVDVAASTPACDRPLAYWFFTQDDQYIGYDYYEDEDGNWYDIPVYYGIKDSITVPRQVQDGSATSFDGLFDYIVSDDAIGGGLSGRVWAKEICGVINCDNVTDLDSLFMSCYHTEKICDIINTENVTRFDYMFSECAKLISTPTIDMRGATSASYMFSGCASLEEVSLKNIKISLTLTSAYKLSEDSLVGVCYELIDTGSTKTLTIGSTNLAKLADVYVKSIPITDEMRAEDDLIDGKMPFVRCESTDEGAMLITDYVVGKNWTLK